MNNIIEIKNLSFRYDDKFIFYRLNLNIEQGEWVSLVGANGSGKTTLMKLLTGLVFNNSEINIDGIRLTKETVADIRKNIGVVFENVDNQFITETVRSEIAFSLENLCVPHDEINYQIEEIARKLKIEKLLEMDPRQLSGGEKQKVALACNLVLNPKILIFDEAFSMIDAFEKEEILELIKTLHKERKMTILNITHNLDESLYGTRIVVLNNGEVVMEGPTLEVLKKDKLLNHIGLALPFMVDLSIKLKLYGLIDEIILDIDEMVDALWK